MAENGFTIPKEIMDFLLGMQKSGIREEYGFLTERNLYAKKGQTVLLGDSLTAQFPLAEMDLPCTVYNRGISGDTSAGVLERLEDNVLSIEPSKLFLLIGINDLPDHISREQTLDNIRTIVAKTKEKLPNCRIYLTDLFPVNHDVMEKRHHPEYKDGRDNHEIMEFNKKLQSVDNVIHLNANSILSDENGNLKEEYTHEGLHLSFKGYIAYLNYLYSFLSE